MKNEERIVENQREPHIYCDFDGVLVDFEKGYHSQYGHHPHDVSEADMWRTISGNMSHWEQLPVMPGALQLWAHIAHRGPTILTGCPRSGFARAREGKTIWKDRELGTHVPIITDLSRNKPRHMSGPGDILIDDMDKNIRAWEEAGGLGILHVTAEQTIARLVELGL